MKAAGANVLGTLSGTNLFVLVDLVQILRRDLTLHSWTTASSDVTIGGTTWSASGPLVSAGRFRQQGGRSIDTRDIVLECGDSTTVGGVKLQELARRGVFRGASVVVSRAFKAPPLTTADLVTQFSGEVSDPEITSTTLTLHCAPISEGLNLQVPRMKLDPQCQNVVYDSLCAYGALLMKTTHTFTGTLTGTPTTTVLPTSLTPPAGDWTSGAAYGLGYYGLGVLTITSGALAGTVRSVATSSGGTLTLIAPLPSAPAAGVTFSIVQGCNKTSFHCRLKFNRWDAGSYRGTDTIPTTSGAK